MVNCEVFPIAYKGNTPLVKSLLKEKVGISWSREMVIGPWPIGGIWLGYDQVGREGTKLLPKKWEIEEEKMKIMIKGSYCVLCTRYIL